MVARYRDLTGQKLGHWTVIEKTSRVRHGSWYWLCECDCFDKTRREVHGSSLLKGRSTSCGCARRGGEQGSPIGQRFGLLVVIRFGYKEPNKEGGWWCQCDCDPEGKNLTFSSLHQLRSGSKESCGCATKKALARRTMLKHGPGDVGFTRVLHQYLSSVHKNKHWKLTDVQARHLFSENCFYCGTPPSNVMLPFSKDPEARAYGSFTAGGIDRVDSSGDYVWENCVPCCQRCNYGKRDVTLEEFADHCQQVAFFLTGVKFEDPKHIYKLWLARLSERFATASVAA